MQIIALMISMQLTAIIISMQFIAPQSSTVALLAKLSALSLPLTPSWPSFMIKSLHSGTNQKALNHPYWCQWVWMMIIQVAHWLVTCSHHNSFQTKFPNSYSLNRAVSSIILCHLWPNRMTQHEYESHKMQFWSSYRLQPHHAHHNLEPSWAFSSIHWGQASMGGTRCDEQN